MADRLAEPVDVRLASAGVALVTLVTLNLPQLRNAMTTELTAAWTTAMDEAAVNGPAAGARLCLANAHSGQAERAEGQGP